MLSLFFEKTNKLSSKRPRFQLSSGIYHYVTIGVYKKNCKYQVWGLQKDPEEEMGPLYGDYLNITIPFCL